MADQSLVDPVKFLQNDPTVIPCLGIGRFNCDCGVVARECCIGTAQIAEQDTAIDQRRHEVWVEPYSPIIADERLIQALDITEGVGTACMGCGITWINGQGAVEASQRRVMASELGKRKTLIAMSRARPLVHTQGIFEQPHSFERLALLQLEDSKHM